MVRDVLPRPFGAKAADDVEMDLRKPLDERLQYIDAVHLVARPWTVAQNGKLRGERRHGGLLLCDDETQLRRRYAEVAQLVRERSRARSMTITLRFHAS